jgi:membrane protease subunit (stomatin/prohibitin family)
MKYQAELGFYGYTLYKVEEPKLFVNEFFGNRSVSSSSEIGNYIRGFINERVIDEFGEQDIFSIVKNVDETTDIVALKIADEAARIGLKIIDAVFEGVKIPEEARRFASGMGQHAMTMQYMKETATELKDSQGGGAAAAGLGAGMGLTMPFMMQQQMQQAQMQQAQQPQQVVVCPNCGNKNPVSLKFCGNCGTSLVPPAKIICQECKTENPATMKFCGNCGKPLTMKTETTCAKCGTKNATSLKFCGNCGEKIT